MQPRHHPHFRRLCIEMLGRLGAKESKLTWYELQLDTRIGPLLLNPLDGWLAARFDDIQRAAALLNPGGNWTSRLNPHSGKWNFHFDDTVTPEIAVEFIERNIRQVLPA
ncbi:hypothetical protein [Piscinibacter gummiphilus]|uniref:Uncharacterized protein n=1 Tax=Piscinibacter gummiphilus TaxID=946333 RepID=A0ABZ0CNG1_9BURK|nr:hypothetical protein [Piscinibacter gummiphilus]WOB06512.1 hypothetical protein RXV79_16440 [Piscinibacter gummiphilus]